MNRYDITVMPKRNESINLANGDDVMSVNLSPAQRWVCRTVAKDDKIFYEVFHKKRGVHITMNPVAFNQFFMEIVRKGE